MKGCHPKHKYLMGSIMNRGTRQFIEAFTDRCAAVIGSDEGLNKVEEPAGMTANRKSMNWPVLRDRLKETVSEPDHALLIELASGALLLAWTAHWVAG